MDFLTLTLEVAQNRQTIKSISRADSNTKYVVSAAEATGLGELCDLQRKRIVIAGRIAGI